jgi:hypothetical protein
MKDERIMPDDELFQPLEFHPLSDLFPMMDDAALQELAADIKENGLEDQIILLDGKILDGRNRYEALLINGTDPSGFIKELDHDDFLRGDPLAYVLSKNLHRRHLTASQRAMVASKLATMRQGERTDLAPSATLQKVSRSTAAAALNVSERSVASAAVVREHGTPELVAAVEAGAIPVSTAATLAREPAEQQNSAVVEIANNGRRAARPADDGDDAPPRRTRAHQAEVDTLTARIRELELAGSSVDFGRDNADQIARTIVSMISAGKARKIAENIITRLDARRSNGCGTGTSLQ